MNNEKSPPLYYVLEAVTHHGDRKVTFGDMKSALEYYFNSRYPKKFMQGSTEIELPKLKKLKEKLRVKVKR